MKDLDRLVVDDFLSHLKNGEHGLVCGAITGPLRELFDEVAELRELDALTRLSGLRDDTAWYVTRDRVAT